MASMETTVLRDHTLRACHYHALLKALRGYYVIVGQEPAISEKGAGADMSIDVGAFKYVLDGIFGEKTSTTNVVIETADVTNPRIDVAILNSDSDIVISKGTAKAAKPVGETTWQKWEEPYPADLSTTDGIILAEIEVPAGVTSIVNAYIRNICVPVAF